MKKGLHELPRVLREPIGETGAEVVVTHAGSDADGLPRARIAIWRDDEILATDVLRLDRDADRRRLIRAALREEQRRLAESVRGNGAGGADGDGSESGEQVGSSVVATENTAPLITAGEIERTLLRVAEALRAVGTPPEETRTPANRAPAPGGTTDAEVTSAEVVDQRPPFIVRDDLAECADEAQRLLLATPQHGIYKRARMLVRVVREEAPNVADLTRPPGAPVIETMTVAHLRDRLARPAQWCVLTKKEGYRPVIPPKWVPETMLARGDWPFPRLEAVIETPTLRPDGTILDTPGYDPATCLLYEPSAEFPPVPREPHFGRSRGGHPEDPGALQRVPVRRRERQVGRARGRPHTPRPAGHRRADTAVRDPRDHAGHGEGVARLHRFPDRHRAGADPLRCLARGRRSPKAPLDHRARGHALHPPRQRRGRSRLPLPGRRPHGEPAYGSASRHEPPPHRSDGGRLAGDREQHRLPRRPRAPGPADRPRCEGRVPRGQDFPPPGPDPVGPGRTDGAGGRCAHPPAGLPRCRTPRPRPVPGRVVRELGRADPGRRPVAGVRGSSRRQDEGSHGIRCRSRGPGDGPRSVVERVRERVADARPGDRVGLRRGRKPGARRRLGRIGHPKGDGRRPRARPVGDRLRRWKGRIVGGLVLETEDRKEHGAALWRVARAGEAGEVRESGESVSFDSGF